MAEQGNNYHFEPKEDERFYSSKARKVVEAVLNERLAKLQYDPNRGAELNQQIAAAIRSRLKSTMNIPRYKLAVQVVSGQIKGQGMRIASKCLWDVNFDNWASYTFQNDQMFCTGIVFGIYYE